MRPVFIVVLLALALGITPLSARVGETLDQCKKRYGKATEATPPYDFGSDAPDLIYYDFEKNGILIEIGFLNGNAADLSFHHMVATPPPASKSQPDATPPPAALTQTEIDILLAANAGGMQWKTVTDGKLTFFPDIPTPTTRYGSYQQRDDGVMATVDGSTLHIFTPEWMAYINEKIKAHNERVTEDQKKNLEGF